MSRAPGGRRIFLALLVTHALSSQGIVFAVPYRQIVYFVVAAIVVGILAAILPATALLAAPTRRTGRNPRNRWATHPRRGHHRRHCHGGCDEIRYLRHCCSAARRFGRGPSESAMSSTLRQKL